MPKRAVTTPKKPITKQQEYHIPKEGLQKSKIKQSQHQKVIQDQHYSNNIAMTVLSTLESLEGQAKGNRMTHGQKNYGYYDKVNYDAKNYDQLKSQLQSQLGVLKASRQVFQQENPLNKYEMPKAFNQEAMHHEIQRYKTAFKSDPDVRGMCSDLEKINNGDYHSPMNFEKKSYGVKYPQHQEAKFRKETVQRGIHASIVMDREKEYINSLNIENQRDLPIHIRNPVTHSSYQYYRKPTH